MRDTLLSFIGMLAAISFAGGYSGVDAAQSFVNRAVVSGRFELSAAELAKAHGSEATRAFASRARSDQQTAQRELERIAGQEKLEVPDQLDARHAAMLAELTDLDGEAFDRAYARMQVSVHQAAVSLYEAEALDGQDADLRGFAEGNLPKLRERLERARVLYE